jgi:hypothetical protein
MEVVTIYSIQTFLADAAATALNRRHLEVMKHPVWHGPKDLSWVKIANFLRGKRGEQSGRHLGGEILEYANRPGDETIAKMT